MFGSRHSCLEFQFRVGVRTLVLHVPSHCVSVRSRVRLAAHSSVLVLCCCTQLVFFIGGVLSCCHVLCEHVAYEYSH